MRGSKNAYKNLKSFDIKRKEILNFIRETNSKYVVHWQDWVKVGEIAKEFNMTIDEVINFCEDNDELNLIVGCKQYNMTLEISKKSDYIVEYLNDDEGFLFDE